MASYKVTWEIDIDEEESPLFAVMRAYIYMREVDSIANVFKVENKETHEIVTVDLGEYNESLSIQY